MGSMFQRCQVEVNADTQYTTIEYDGITVAGESVAEAVRELAEAIERRYENRP